MRVLVEIVSLQLTTESDTIISDTCGGCIAPVPNGWSSPPALALLQSLCYAAPGGRAGARAAGGARAFLQVGLGSGSVAMSVQHDCAEAFDVAHTMVHAAPSAAARRSPLGPPPPAPPLRGPALFAIDGPENSTRARIPGALI